MPQTGFVIQVPEADACVGSLRDRFDATARLGMAAHVTILFPFMAPEAIDNTTLRQIRDAIASIAPFRFSLASVGRFPATTWLAPDPPGPFVALTERLAAAFPAYPPFGGEFDSIIPHLTAAHGDAAEAALAERELKATMAAQGPIAGWCHSLTLLENASGRWKTMHEFALR
jgi:2'-5' RNA ligase